MERMSAIFTRARRHVGDPRGLSLYETIAAVAMVAILAGVAVPTVVDHFSDGKAARAAQETEAIYQAMTAFRRDTGKMPGEAEILADGSDKALLVSDLYGPLPDNASVALALSGLSIGATGICAQGCLDLNDYLVRQPDGIKYRNWRGPYIGELKNDPFDRIYVVNVRALVRAESADAVDGGSFGYGWVPSGGPDQRLDTNLAGTELDKNSDDLGRNNGKKNRAQ
jgi:type II secretory pathway pseudopilin PulG